MKHYSAQAWQRWIRNQVSEQEHRQMEHHLQHCGPCLETYISMLDRFGEGWQPPPQWSETVVELALAEAQQSYSHSNPMHQNLGDRNPANRNSSRRSPVKPYQENRKKPVAAWRHTLLHYVIAASVTLLLMTSGVFQQIMADPTEQWQSTQVNDELPLSSQWTERISDTIEHIMSFDLSKGGHDS